MAIGNTGKHAAIHDLSGVMDRHGANSFYFYKRVTGSTTAWVVVEDLEFAVKVIGVKIICRATNSSGTVRIDNGSNAITSAMVCDTNKEVTELSNGDGAGAPATVDDDYYVIPKGGDLNLTTASSADGDVFIECVKDS